MGIFLTLTKLILILPGIISLKYGYLHISSPIFLLNISIGFFDDIYSKMFKTNLKVKSLEREFFDYLIDKLVYISYFLILLEIKSIPLFAVIAIVIHQLILFSLYSLSWKNRGILELGVDFIEILGIFLLTLSYDDIFNYKLIWFIVFCIYVQLIISAIKNRDQIELFFNKLGEEVIS